MVSQQILVFVGLGQELLAAGSKMDDRINIDLAARITHVHEKVSAPLMGAEGSKRLTCYCTVLYNTT